MNRYEIRCTEQQTRKALELGAPIERGHESSRYFNIGVPTFYDENDEVCRVKNSVIFIPTAEQMIGWLEEQGVFLEMRHTDEKKFHIWVGSFIPHPDGYWTKSYPTIKEANLAAIDTALEYLENNEKIKSKNSTV